MFKKIFDLDPNEVETFIKDLVKERYKRGLYENTTDFSFFGKYSRSTG